uniref:Uncharacterized protein n=1 Tax=Heterorhabditis bacteriophora TaxID=37862 RepID=A0A1I7XLA7_HETBA
MLANLRHSPFVIWDMSNTVFNTEMQNIDDTEKTTSRIPKIWKSPKRTTTQRILLPLNITLESATDKSTNKTSVEPAKNKSTSLVSNTVSIVGEEIAANETTGHKKQSTTDKITVTTVK